MKIISLYSILLFISCSSDGMQLDSTPDNDLISMDPVTDTELMQTVQKDVFKYFWDYAHTNSKLSRERLHENDLSFDSNTVTTGGSGFGFLNVLMGIENNIISKEAGISHLQTALDFLENADRFHGAWPHWMDGNSGTVLPFSSMDNGADLVETALLCQGLICIREYFKNGNAEEQQLAQKADILWKGVEWDWFTQGENVLYWHWSPNFDFEINLPIVGYNEGLIAYILGAASPTYPINAAVYHEGWAQNGAIKSETQQYNIPVLLNHGGVNDSVGPLFWSHYSYLTLDPRGLTDRYANYWDVVRNHTQIVLEHCIQNPNEFSYYSDKNWGLTASYSRNTDGSTGYSDHSPTNDRGVISPTAALSSFPYTPEASMKYLRYLYEEKQEDYIGIAGPIDAYAPHFQWKTQRYLAIDQGTIGPMIENHKTQLFWNLFMNAPEIRSGLVTLGFTSTQHGF
ncbi:MAG: glucoamylase family protein [Flavobacteriaceae bacterium]|nr:glucoamylase family protein [Flavobacteriaceae bacterium]